MSERGLLYSFVLLLFPFAAPTELCVASLLLLLLLRPPDALSERRVPT